MAAIPPKVTPRRRKPRAVRPAEQPGATPKRGVQSAALPVQGATETVKTAKEVVKDAGELVKTPEELIRTPETGEEWGEGNREGQDHLEQPRRSRRRGGKRRRE